MVVLIGRSNVGKSTLFNRLIEERLALTSPIPGTTRDRNIASCIWRGKQFQIVDTGGIDAPKTDIFEKDIIAQARIAIEKATVIILVLDATVGVTEADRSALRLLQKQKIPVIIAWNKADTGTSQALALATPLPSGYPVFAVSGKNGSGTGDLLDGVTERLADKKGARIPKTQIKIAIIGKPNVGKSSLTNTLLGEYRVITHEKAHTTREPQSCFLRYKKIAFEIIDTAGIRRKSRVGKDAAAGSDIEKFGVKKSLHALEEATIIFFVIDVTKKITKQDQVLSDLVAKSRGGVLLIANKWDLVAKDASTIHEHEKYIRAHFPNLTWAPIVFTSALEKTRVHELLEMASTIHAERGKIVSQAQLDEFLVDILQKKLPARGRGNKHPKLLTIQQTKTKPPAFVLGFNDPKILHFSYPRFVENELRNHFGLQGVPIRIALERAYTGR